MTISNEPAATAPDTVAHAAETTQDSHDRVATENGFASLGLTGAVLKAIAETGYTTPTPIQAAAIPPLLKGRDLLGLAETGTGKTAAFALPIIQRLVADSRDRTPRKCRVLILAPTRELAIQIAESLATYGKHTTLTHTLIFGGVGANPQMRAMQKGVDFVVATPGRLLDLIASRNIYLDEVTHFVLDEADRMLDMGFIHDVRRIVKLLPKSRQSLLFSATMPDDIAKLAAEMLNNPQRVEVARAGKTVDRIEQSVHFVGAKEKRAALAALLQNPEMKRVIVFTRTKRGANRVADTLEVTGIPAVAIHGNKSQNARQAALEQFRAGAARVLVATDIAARGIDIDDITHVINYELPNIPESYVHRIGRTARAGAEGCAVALCAPDERPYLRDIERLTKTPLRDAGAVAGIAAFASLPEPKNRRGDDDDAPHFERGRSKIGEGRRNNRPFETTSANGPPARKPFEKRDGERGGERPRRDRDERGPPRGDRKPFGERKPFGDRKPAEAGERREWKPREDRAPRADGERPRFNRGPSDRGPSDRAPSDRPRGDRPFGERKPYGDRKPFDGPKREWTPREDRPRDASAAPAGDAAPAKFDPLDVNARRPREERPRSNDRGGDRGGRPAWKGGDRAPRADGERREWKPREDRGPRPAGDRPAGERPAFKPREDRGPRPDGERREWKPRGDSAPRADGEKREWKPRGDGPPRGDRSFQKREGAAGGGGKPWERREGGPRRDGGGFRGKPRDDRGGSRGGNDGSAPRPRGKPPGDRDTGST